MGYLDEAGLAALVGKVKGQMVELTAEEYAQIDPAIKNYDNKLYFVKNDVTGYQIDEEPISGSTGLVKSGGVYNWTSKIGSGSLTTTAKTLIPAVNEVNEGLTEVNEGLTEVTDSIVYRSFTVMGNGTTSADKDVALSGYTPFVAIPTGAIGDLTAMTELYNNSISGNTATFMWQSAKSSSVGIGFTVIYKKN